MIGLRRRLRAFAQLLLAEHRSPSRVGLAVLCGCTIGCTPLFGLHLPICLLVALILRLNKVIVYAAANLSIPPLIPFLGLASVELGELLRHGALLGLRPAEFAGVPLPQLAERFFVSWLCGGLLLGAAIGGALGTAVYVILRRRKGRPGESSEASTDTAAAANSGAASTDPAAASAGSTSTDATASTALSAALLRASRRFAGQPRKFAGYAWFKYRLDPCYRAIAAQIPRGALIVDLGTGLGMLPILLGELGHHAIGVEWDQEKVRCGMRAAEGLPVTLVEGDLRGYPIPPCDVVTLVDVIHYYDPDDQDRLLGPIAAALRPGGLLLIREGDADRRGGARFTRVVERAMVRLSWNRGPKVRFRPLSALREALTHLGFTVTVAEVAGKLHPGNVLLRCQRDSVIATTTTNSSSDPPS